MCFIGSIYRIKKGESIIKIDAPFFNIYGIKKTKPMFLI